MGRPNAVLKVLGDDSIFILNEIVIEVDFIAKFFEPFGMIVNVDKTIVTRNFLAIIFLGTTFTVRV